MRKVWAIVKAILGFIGRWLGPALIVFAAYSFFFPLGAFGDGSLAPAIAGAVVAAIACIFMRAPVRQSHRKILAVAAVAAFAFACWRYWEGTRGYHEEIVSFDNRGVRLVGTLYLPDRPGKVPGIVFLPGSGATPRGFLRPYTVHLAQAGYAVLIYDKRGVGDSSGKREAKGFFSVHRDLEALASDASAGLSFLAARPEVRSDAVGFTGLSEGGFIAPRAAVLNGHAAFMLILTSPTTSLYQTVVYQDVTRDRGKSAEQSLAEAKRWFGKDFDPMVSLRALEIPGLWLFASEDTLEPNAASIRNLRGLQQLGKPYEYRVIPGAWHGLVIGPKAPVEDTIGTWLAKVAAQKQ